jgi:5-aminolevulinate synthase
MESLLRQGKQVCPFLKRSSPACLKMLATSFHTTSRGYRVSGLQTAARQCPVIGKALDVQQQKRDYVTKSANVAMSPSHPGLAESISLEEAHRAAGVTDLSKGTFLLENRRLMVGTCPHAEAARKAHGLKFEEPKKFDYEAFYTNELDKKHKDKSYRYFNNINRVPFVLLFWLTC